MQGSTWSPSSSANGLTAIGFGFGFGLGLGQYLVALLICKRADGDATVGEQSGDASSLWQGGARADPDAVKAHRADLTRVGGAEFMSICSRVAADEALRADQVDLVDGGAVEAEGGAAALAGQPA